MGGAGAKLEVDEAEVYYGALKVLDGISLAVEGGEFIALLGSSGCGKTTLLRAICGFVPVTSGRIAVAGRDITDLAPDKRDMAMVFQSYALWPHMTVAQNIGYGLRLRRVGRAEIAERVAAMLAMLRLGGLAARRVTELSGGQRQRVALGRAHDREEAMVMADRIVILDKGRIAQMGAPEAIYNAPNSPFVADFMGAGNVVRLRARRLSDGSAPEGIAIEAGPHNGALTLAGDALRDALPQSGAIVAHFRGEAARLQAPMVPDDAANGGELVLRGRIAQASYPGGVWRYSVRVGEDHFLVDDARRLDIGEAVGIGLPAASLHLFAANP